MSTCPTSCGRSSRTCCAAKHKEKREGELSVFGQLFFVCRNLSKEVCAIQNRRVTALLRLALVGGLLLLQIALVVLASYLLRQRMFYAYAALETLALICALRIYNRPGGSSYKHGWILLVLALPVVGLVLYYLWSGDCPNKRLELLPIAPPQEPEAARQYSRQRTAELGERNPAWGKLAAYLERQGYLLWGDTQVTYFPSGESYLEDMLQHLGQAERFIFLEYYIVAAGEIWDRLKAILLQKAAQGVEIKLIFDDFGSMFRLPPEQLEQLRQQGIGVTLFNPVHHYVNRAHFNYRDHRKITCIDGNISYTGGVNLADEYANRIVRFGHWKDCGVRLEGEGAWGLTREFLHMWRRLGGALRDAEEQYRPQRGEGAGYCQTVADGPDNNPQDTAEDVFVHLIAGARRWVYIATPYLTIDDAMRKALCIAADSGVDVRLLMPGVADHKTAYWVGESYFGELLRHGVKIYRYTPGLQHGKAVVADGEAAFVGTVNMDYRSFRLHFECGVVLYELPAIRQILQDMEAVMGKSHRVLLPEWERRPWQRRLLGWLLRPFASWM